MAVHGQVHLVLHPGQEGLEPVDVLAEGVDALAQLVHHVSPKVLVEGRAHARQREFRAPPSLGVLPQAGRGGLQARHGRLRQGPARVRAGPQAMLGNPAAQQTEEIFGRRLVATGGRRQRGGRKGQGRVEGGLEFSLRQLAALAVGLLQGVLGGFVGAVQARVYAGVGRAPHRAHLLGFHVPVLGLDRDARTHPQAVAFLGDGELHGGGAVSGQGVEAELAGEFHTEQGS